LQATNYAGHLAALAHEHGLKLTAEAYGNGPFDDLLYASKVDVPMSEFWNETDHHAKFHTTKAMASAAHIFGKSIVAAESFTAWPANARWRSHPFSLKMLGDTAFSYGVNRIVFHRYAHQPWRELRPGMTMGMWGVHYERTQTWWEHSKPWHEYLARCQHLSRARARGDILYLTSENAYHRSAQPELNPFRRPATTTMLPRRKRSSPKVSLQRKLRHPNGAEYQVQVLPPVTTMTPHLHRRIAELVAAVAKVLVAPPTSLQPGRVPGMGTAARQVASSLWGKCDGRTILENRYGNGRVVWGRPLNRVLAEINTPPDFDQLTATSKPLRRIHQKLGAADFYFVANPNSNAVTVDCRFRVSLRQPELWDPATGNTEPSMRWRADAAGTIVRLDLEPMGSCFVVFRENVVRGRQVTRLHLDEKPTDVPITLGRDGQLWLRGTAPGTYEARLENGTTLRGRIASDLPRIEVEEPWLIRFPPGRGAPEQIVLPRLTSLHEHPEFGVRHFSGIATYRTRFRFPGTLSKTNRVCLDLGLVEVTAAVRVNGREAATLWKPPFRTDITSLVIPGENALEIDVATLWPNRLIGDEHLADDCTWTSPEIGATGTALKEWPDWLRKGEPRPSPRVAFATRRFWAKDEPLLRSGLIGPVQIITEAVIPLRQ